MSEPDPIPGPVLPSIVQSVALARDPLGVLRRCRTRYGRNFTLELAQAGKVVVVSSPREAFRIADGDPQLAHAGEARRGVLPQASRHSSFGADEPHHREARGRIEPALAKERVEGLRAEIETIAQRHVDSWPVGRPFRVLSRLRTLAEDVFVRLALGLEGAHAEELVRAVGRALRTPGNPPITPLDPDRDLLGPPFAALADARLAPLKKAIAEEVRRGADGPGGPAILDHIASKSPHLEPEEVADELIVVLAAGQEPPSIALTWALRALSSRPDLRAAALSDRQVLLSVIDESLRLRPPALASLRRLRNVVPVGQSELRPGTDVMVPLPLLHTDPEIWPDPGKFDGERFVHAERPEAFRPFGVGTRSCPAEPLARATLEAVLPVALERYDFRFLDPRERPVQRATVLVPNRSGLAVARPVRADRVRRPPALVMA